MTSPIIPEQGTVLLIGDSITDCGRDRTDPDSLGDGYAAMVAERHAAEHPRARVRFVNRGIGGDRAADLRQRWAEDCLAVKADVVSVLVGINEVWRRFDSDDPTPHAVYEDHYRALLGEAAEQGSALVLVEPFLVPVSEEQRAYREDLDGKQAVVRRLALDFGAVLVPAGEVMTRAAATGDPHRWTQDGVHPTPAGHALLARAWLDAVSVGKGAAAGDGAGR